MAAPPTRGFGAALPRHCSEHSEVETCDALKSDFLIH